jgi:putative PIN family toxin of toxin-antitoxin system
MKVILDTNVFVSGAFFSGPPFQILAAWRESRVQLIISPEILEEYRRVGKILAEDHPGVRFESILEFVIQNALLVSSPPLPEGVCADPDDDKFLACALASESDIVVSGDRHLLKVSGYQNIEVLNPREFLEKHLF